MASRAGRVVMAAIGGKGKRSLAVALPSASSNLGKFLGIPEPHSSATVDLITKFIELNNRQGPGMKKGFFTEKKLKEMLSGKNKIGIPEIAKLLSGQNTKAATTAA